MFSSPVGITAGTTYIASYLAPNGHFSMTRPGFASAVTNGPLTAPASGSTTYGNGVYANGTHHHLPDQQLPGHQLRRRHPLQPLVDT